MNNAEQIKAEVEELLLHNPKLKTIKLVKEKYDFSLRESMQLVVAVQNSMIKEGRPFYADTEQARNSPVLPPFVSNLLLVIGLFFLSIAGYFFYTDYAVVAQAVLVPGQVVDFTTNESGTAPIVAYSFEGKDYKYYGEIFSSPPSYTMNEAVELYVIPTNPQFAVLNGFMDRFFLVVVFGFIGGAFAIIGIIIKRF